MKNLINIQTQGIKYAGSKLKLISYILDSIKNLKIKSVLDGFSGTTRVSQAFAQMGLDTTANDIAYWSETFAQCYLLAKNSHAYYQELIGHLNSIPPKHGWFSEHYGGSLLDYKKPFQIKNTQKLDAIREEIAHLSLSNTDEAVALTSLILALDKVDSTLGHHVSYLAKWSPRSFDNLKLQVPKIIKSAGNHQVIREDIFDTIEKNEYDLVYFDPPYGSNNKKMPASRVRYASYYHLWTTIIKNDRPPLFGKANRRIDSKDEFSASIFEEFRKDKDGNFFALKAIQKLIEKSQASFVLFSYSSGGRATKSELLEILQNYGKIIKALEIDYQQNVMKNMTWTNQWSNHSQKHKEYLFLMEKQ